MAYHVVHPLSVGKVVGSILCKNRVIAKDVVPFAIHYHAIAQLELSKQFRAIKRLVVCYVVWLGSMKRGWILGLNFKAFKCEYIFIGLCRYMVFIKSRHD